MAAINGASFSILHILWVGVACCSTEPSIFDTHALPEKILRGIYSIYDSTYGRYYGLSCIYKVIVKYWQACIKRLLHGVIYYLKVVLPTHWFKQESNGGERGWTCKRSFAFGDGIVLTEPVLVCILVSLDSMKVSLGKSKGNSCATCLEKSQARS